MLGFFFYNWESDYLAVSNNGYVYECEIKISHSDFLNEASHKSEKMSILQEQYAKTINNFKYDNQEIDYLAAPIPNYFWYVCPDGVISEIECPKFAGLMYITDDDMFLCIKKAPLLHKIKYDIQVNLLSINMPIKLYYAMWNWIRRYWRNITNVERVTSKTISEYEVALENKEYEIRQLKSKISDLMRK